MRKSCREGQKTLKQKILQEEVNEMEWIRIHLDLMYHKIFAFNSNTFYALRFLAPARIDN